jgi:hypothetical protein
MKEYFLVAIADRDEVKALRVCADSSGRGEEVGQAQRLRRFTRGVRWPLECHH